MSALGEVLNGIREAVVMGERVRALSEHVDVMDSRLADARERIVRLEAVLSVLRPVGPALIDPPGR